MAENWIKIFKKLNNLTAEEGFDVSIESEKYGKALIRKQNRAISKLLASGIFSNYFYFKFITPIIENYIYEPIFHPLVFPKNTLFLKSTNPCQGDVINATMIINSIEIFNFIIQPEESFHLFENISENFLQEVELSENGYLVNLKFNFGNSLISPGTNYHFIIQ